MKMIECIKDKYGALIPIEKITYISKDHWVSIGGERKDISGTTLKFLRCIFKEINIENAIQEKPADKVVWHDSTDESKKIVDEKIREAIRSLIIACEKDGTIDGVVKEHDALVWLEKQKPAEWSEEDESWFRELELMALSFSDDDSYRKKFFDWLKSLKKRVQPQPKQEWSEEKEKDLFNAAKHLREYAERCVQGEYSKIEIFSLADRIESLRPQSHWKPSEEQMKTLNEVINFAADHATVRWNDYIYNILKSLREQLKKL